MDSYLAILKRLAQTSGDPTDVWNYASALERALFGGISASPNLLETAHELVNARDRLAKIIETQGQLVAAPSQLDSVYMLPVEHIGLSHKGLALAYDRGPGNTTSISHAIITLLGSGNRALGIKRLKNWTADPLIIVRPDGRPWSGSLTIYSWEYTEESL